MKFLQAETTAEALDALGCGARVIAGGSDLIVRARQSNSPLPDHLVAIDRVSTLKQIQIDDSSARIGAAVTYAQLVDHPAIAAQLTAIRDASLLIGSPATRHVGTIGGNAMNASPAMDTGAPLAVLGARAVLESISGSRTMSLTDLWLGPGQTSARPDELLTEIVVDLPDRDSGTAYHRLEYRRSMEIAVAGAAAALRVDRDGLISSIRVALSAAAPTILEIQHLDAAMGATLAEASAVAKEQSMVQCSPISDVRASAEYRRHCMGVMAARAVATAYARATGQAVAQGASAP